MTLTAVDLLPDVFEVEDQGALGSCTANAGLSALELMYKRAGDPRDFSRLYLYYWERANMGLKGDTGADPVQITRVLQDRGVCLESTWPYDPELLDVPPSAAAEAEAPHYRIGGAEFIQLAIADLDTILERIKASLRAGIPVLQTSLITQSFMALKHQRDWRTHGFSMATSETNAPLGSHETLIIGYDDAFQMFLCQNSWGPDWADGGFFGVPYSFMGNAWIQQLWFLTDAGVRAIPVPEPLPPGKVPTPAPWPAPPLEGTPAPANPIPQPSPQVRPGASKISPLMIAVAIAGVILALTLIFNASPP